MSYDAFIEGKKQIGGEFGFAPTFMPEFLFPFQRSLVDWLLRKAIGVELKETYFRQAVRNLASVDDKSEQELIKLPV